MESLTSQFKNVMFSPLKNPPIGPLMPWPLAAGLILPIVFAFALAFGMDEDAEPSKSQVSRRHVADLKRRLYYCTKKETKRRMEEAGVPRRTLNGLNNFEAKDTDEFEAKMRQELASPFWNWMKRIGSMIRTDNRKGAKAFMKRNRYEEFL